MNGKWCPGLIVDRAYKGWIDEVKVGIRFCETMESLIWWGVMDLYVYVGRDVWGREGRGGSKS